MGLRLLILEDEGDLPFESIALDQVSNVPLPVEELQNQHFYQDESGVNRGEDTLHRILLPVAILICIVLVVSYRFEYHSIRT